MKAPLRTWIEVDGAALRHNLSFLHKRADGARIVAAVKANAYGHGLLPVARELAAAASPVAACGVADVDELRALRRGRGWVRPVLLLSAAQKEEMEEIVSLRGWPTLSTVQEARWLAAAARKLGRTAEAHFKVDTGMGRLGLPPEEAVAALRAVLRLPGLRIGGLCSHCAAADDDPAFTRRQARVFHAWRAAFPEIPWHLENSAALLSGAATDGGRHGDWVRPGLALYGLGPRPEDEPLLRPVLSLKARLTLVRRLPAGRTISYGATYRLPRPQTLAVVAAGYGDGYPRALSNRADVLVRGVRCPVRGRVTMDQIIVDVSGAPGARSGDAAVLLGRQDGEEIAARELAEKAGTISYEIVTRLAERLPRRYLRWS
ncbi:MAG: alanine racemase [Verrucomicrobium sp.]|nr:alanine racemase [Verrucomicrobium sp.]